MKISSCVKSIRSISGFTLVELIVVITILVILGTISFLSLSGYGASARDSVRVSDLSNIQQGLDIRLVKYWSVPPPTGNILSIISSGTVIGYQGYVGDSVLGLIDISAWGGKDPADRIPYIYSIDTSYIKFQLMAFLEDGSMKLSDNTFVQRANAVDFVSRYPIVRGKNLGILLGSSGSELNRPLQEYYDPLSFTGIDITSYTGSLGSASGFGPLKAVVSNTEVFIGTGRTITGIETNYRGTMDIVTSTCPSGWNPSNKTLKWGSLFFRSWWANSVICEARGNAPIPSGTEIVTSGCPSGWALSSKTLTCGALTVKLGLFSPTVCVAP